MGEFHIQHRKATLGSLDFRALISAFNWLPFVVFESTCLETMSATDMPGCQCKTSRFTRYKRFERSWAESWYNPMAPTPAKLSTVVMAEQLFWVKPLIFLCLPLLPKPRRKGSQCWQPICSPASCLSTKETIRAEHLLAQICFLTQLVPGKIKQISLS